jgi:hypothetical protein
MKTILRKKSNQSFIIDNREYLVNNRSFIVEYIDNNSNVLVRKNYINYLSEGISIGYLGKQYGTFIHIVTLENDLKLRAYREKRFRELIMKSIKLENSKTINDFIDERV